MSAVFEAFDLSGRVAVITGAASGIGRASAVALAQAGARVVLGDIDAAGLEQTAAQLGGAVAGVASRRTDVTRRDDLEALLECAVSEFGRLDLLANVAGILQESSVVETQEVDLDRVLAVNLKGVYFACQLAVPIMAKQGSGSIVNIASSAAFSPYPGFSSYTISKAAVVALTRVLAAEVGPAGIRVNAIAPGMVDTPMAWRATRLPEGSSDAERREASIAAARRRSPLGTEGRPEDIAQAVLYLASDAARYMTGQVLHPNGGVPMV